jgi:tRNA U34 5-methylaminomethyl-2-thiouridine-forming methyltransferase MnmC
LKREIIQTLDGSTTIQIAEWNEFTILSMVQFRRHSTYLLKWSSLFPNQNVAILEIGFGTGLNAFITFLSLKKLQQSIEYVGVEAYPISVEVLSMNYVSELNANQESAIFDSMHTSNWEEKLSLSTDFSLLKRKQFFEEINDIEALI